MYLNLKLNNDKCHLLLSGYKHDAMWRNIDYGHIWESKRQKLLSIIIHKNMKFAEYGLKQCKIVGKKICALGRLCNFLSLK